MNEIEEQFFKVFGIEEQCICPYFQGKKDCNEKNRYKYPEITDRKLLEMICIMNKHIHKHDEYALCPVAGENLEEVKNYMLRLFNVNQPLLEKNFIQEIRQLFKGEE